MEGIVGGSGLQRANSIEAGHQRLKSPGGPRSYNIEGMYAPGVADSGGANSR